MDNLTHTLIGIALGETASRRGVKPRMAAIYTSILGNNLPDLDFLLPLFSPHKSLDYLLNHRGITHSFLMAVPIGLFSAWAGAKLGRVSGGPERRLYVLGVVSAIFHVLADYCNNYGVHPFSPFLNRWYYGDFIFIVEPLFLFILLPFVFFTAQTRIGKIIPIILQVFLIGIVLSQKFTLPQVSVFLVLWAIFMNWIQSRSKSLVPVFASMITVLGAFCFGSLIAQKRIYRDSADRDRNAKVVQLATSPAPANPLCWSATLLEVTSKQEYLARSGFISLLPSVISPESCAFKFFQKIDRLSSVENINPRIYWVNEFKRPIEEFRALAQQNCIFKEFLKFSRVPIWYESPLGRISEDLRYIRKSGGFTSIDLDLTKECPYETISWVPPTDSLL